jgi:hypothetical protein
MYRRTFTIISKNFPLFGKKLHSSPKSIPKDALNLLLAISLSSFRN